MSRRYSHTFGVLGFPADSGGAGGFDGCDAGSGSGGDNGCGDSDSGNAGGDA